MSDGNDSHVDIFEDEAACIVAAVDDERFVFRAGDLWALAKTKHQLQLALVDRLHPITKLSAVELGAAIGKGYKALMAEKAAKQAEPGKP